jgi:hypothetical protein
MHKAKEGTFLEFPKAFPGLFATLWHLQHIFVCDFWDNLRTGKAQWRTITFQRAIPMAHNHLPKGHSDGAQSLSKGPF